MHRTLFSATLASLLLLPGLANASVTCGTPPADAAAWWRAEDNALDQLGCHDGTLKGATFGLGIGLGLASKAFSFDGANDYVEVPDHPLWTLGTDSFVIGLWANFASDNGADRIFIGADEGGGTQDKWIFLHSGGKLVFHVNGPVGGSHWLVEAPHTPTVGEWHHYAVTRVGSELSILVDGEVVGSDSFSGDIPDPNGPLTIGQAEGLGYFHGLLDEIQILRP